MGGVEHLLRRHSHVDHLEVLLEAVPNKDAASVDQLAQLEVGRLHSGDVVRRDGRVEVPRPQPREARQVVDHRLRLGDVRVDESLAVVRPLAAHARHARKREPRRLDHHVGASLAPPRHLRGAGLARVGGDCQQKSRKYERNWGVGGG